MGKLFTPIQSVAAAGLLKNKGLGVSANLIAAVNSFNSTDYITSVNSALVVNSAPEVVQALNSLPQFFTGNVGTSLRATVPQNLQSNFDFSNLVNDVLNQGNLVVSTGSAGVIDILTQAKLYCRTTFDVLGTFAKMQTLSFDEFGLTVRNYQDALSGGVSSQYRTVLGVIDPQIELPTGETIVSGYAALANQIGNFGTMYDIRNLSRLSDPRTLCQNLLTQGFYFISQALVDAGVTVSNLANEDVRLVNQALSTIKGADLKNIISVTKFKPYKQIENLLEVLDIQKVLSPAAATAAGGSFSDLSRKLTNIGGSFSSFADVKLMYSSIQTANVSALSSLTSSENYQLFVGASDTLGKGSGIFGNPIVSDIIGSAGGIGYIDNINQLTDILSDILATDPGKALKDAILSSITTPNNSTVAQNITSAIAGLYSSSSVNDLVSQGNTKFNTLFETLLNERKNVEAARLDLTSASDSLYSITSFVSDLHNLHQDQENIKYADMIKSITTDDVFGQAIFAAIVEGNNIAQLNSRGIPSYTRLDPVEYADFISKQNPCG